ncbi:hypothetical protein WJX82_008466 [Trebouxia sp. C0006]
MEYLMGIKGKDFVMLCGDPGDRVQFSEYIMANVRLYALRNGQQLTTDAVANYTRGELATALRKKPYQVNILFAGFDEKAGPSLYWMDYLATMHKMNIAGNGYGSYFVLAMLDKLWHPNLTEAEALELHIKGIDEVKNRLVVAPPDFIIKVVDKHGVRDVTPSSLKGVTGQGKDRICDMKTLGLAMHAARDGTGEVRHLLSSTTFNPRLPGLTKMVSRLGKEGAWRKALEIYQSLPQTGVCPDTAITNAAISACDKGGQWRAALGIYGSMDAQGLRQDAITCSSLISALAKGKQWALALQVFDDMQARGSSTTISYSPSDYTPKHAEQNSSLEHTGSGVGLHSPARPPYAAYSQALTGQTSSSSDLLQSFSSMHVGDTAPSVQRALFPQEQPGQQTAVTSTSHERSDSTVRRIQEAAMNRQEMLSLRPTTNPVGGSMGSAPVLRHMNVSQIAPNRVCCNALLAAYARAKPTLWQKALAFLEVMQSSTGHIQPDTVTYNTVLKACCNAGQLNRAMQVFQTMVGSGVELTITTFGTLLIAGADAHDYKLVQEVWAYLEQAGLEANPACINAYVQALVHQGEWSEAQKLFKHLLGRGSRVRAPIVTINTIMAAYMKQGMFEQVQQVFDDMNTAGLQPNIMTYVTLLSSYAELGNWQYAMQVLSHMCRTQVAIVPNTLSFNHVLAALLKAATQSCTPEGLPANGAGLMRIISSCSQLGRWDEAYAAWTVLQAAGMQLDGACLNALLAALQAAKQWQHVVQVFQAARQTQVQPDSAAYNTVLAALLDAEQLQGSLSIVNDMRLQRLPVETASCDRLVLMLMMTGELELACNVTQDLLEHGRAVGSEALARMVHLLKEDGQVWKAFHLIKTAHQVAPTVKLDSDEYIYLADKALTLDRRSSKGEAEHPYSADAGSLDVAHIVKLIGLSVDTAIVVVLSWAAQLAQLEEACIVIKAETIKFILGEEDSSFDPTALRLALTKLLKLNSEKYDESISRSTVDKSALPADLHSTWVDRNDMTLAASHLYLWLDMHREALKKLLYGNQAATLPSVLSNDQKLK